MADLVHDLTWPSYPASTSTAFPHNTAAHLSAPSVTAMLDPTNNGFTLSCPPQRAPLSRQQSFDALLSSLSSSTGGLARLPSFSAFPSHSYLPLPLDDSDSFNFHLADDASYYTQYQYQFKKEDGYAEYGVEPSPAVARSMSYESDSSSSDSLPPLSPHSTDSHTDSTASSHYSSTASSTQQSPQPVALQQQRTYNSTDVLNLQPGAAAPQARYYHAAKQPLFSFQPLPQPQPSILQLQAKDQWAGRSTAGWYESGGVAGDSVPTLPMPATSAVHYSFSNNYSAVDGEEGQSDSDADETYSHKRRHHGDEYALSPSSLASSPAAALRTPSRPGGRRDSVLSYVLKQEDRRRGAGHAYDRPMDGGGDADNTQSPTHSAGSYSPASHASSNGRTSTTPYSPSSTSASAPSSPFTFTPGQADSPRSLLLSLAQHARSSHASSTPALAASSAPPAFASYTATASSLAPGLDPHEVVIGIYTRAERAAKIARYREKRTSRQWKKKIMYDCRKSFADNRPRVGGRFIKMKGDEQAKPALARKEGRSGGRHSEERSEERRESKRSRR